MDKYNELDLMILWVEKKFICVDKCIVIQKNVDKFDVNSHGTMDEWIDKKWM